MKKDLRIGLDLGGTKIEAVALRSEPFEPPDIVLRRRIPTEQKRGYDAILESTAALLRDVAAEIGAEVGKIPIGVGMPGGVTRAGLVKNSNTTCLNGRPFRADLERLLGRAIGFDNDANCFAIAEARHGAAKEHRDGVVFGVILGTGCGGGIVIDGVLHAGHQSLAGEWGHTTLDPAGAPCFCGQRGCVETYISGSGLERAHFDATGFRLSAHEIVAAADAGEPACRQLMEGFFAAFGRAMANLVAVLDPDIIVLGGGLSNIDALYTRGVAEVERRVFGGEFATPIVKHRLGDSAGVIGAALLGT